MGMVALDKGDLELLHIYDARRPYQRTHDALWTIDQLALERERTSTPGPSSMLPEVAKAAWSASTSIFLVELATDQYVEDVAGFQDVQSDEKVAIKNTEEFSELFRIFGIVWCCFCPLARGRTSGTVGHSFRHQL